MTKQKSLSMIHAVPQKPNEDPLENLDRIYQVCWMHTDADLEAPENVLMVIMTFIRQSALVIRRKLQCLDGILEMNLSRVVDRAYKVYHAGERRKLKQVTMFLETEQGIQKERQDSKGKENDPLSTNQCTYFKNHCRKTS